ncbi:hypothetical protein GCM10010169_25470 [Micromonospora fulviviridis]|uniref:hypothetical protein n=1 Tax=Micromonospora fulviviridis TaxID=47860 RepID=UPI00166F55C3|nr:hypothetical protein [Micromonospora fulviviridis]GGR80225.1 hypothetical protein GCM10010169_25470 [Micromonospora fulviviridis]
MSQMQNARPAAGNSGAGAKTAGEHVPTSVTDRADIVVLRRNGDPVIARRRIAAKLDDLLGISRERAPEPYAAGGMCLGLAERELAA